MRQFDYIRPTSLADAIAAWSPGAAYLGGGTNLVDLMKIGVQQPDRLIDLGRLPGLDRIEMRPDGGARIGALVRNADLAHDPAFAAAFPVVAEALLAGASGQLRNMATVGGNLMQRPRCAYFQDPHSACNRRAPGAGCAARGGEASGLAVLGWSDSCIATNPSDFGVALAALDAVVEVQGPDGGREIPFAAFHRLPGDTPEIETALAPGELILALCLPAGAAAFRDHARYLKLRERTSFAFALVSAAAALRMEGDRIAAALAGEADEVLVVGHSSGAHLAVSVLSALIRAGRVPSDGPALGLLTLGQVVPMLSFLPRAARLRGDLRFLSTRDELAWIDISAPGDGCSFALCDPVTVSGVAPEAKRWPLVISAAFTQTLSPERWKALRWRFFRLHFQYLCAFDRPGDYDYFRVTAGPQTLAARYDGRPASKSRIEVAVSKYTSVQAA
ncbi:hypothetical protein CVM52_02950 [Pseudooceanicola lipolyticus]|uniref:FAD-binding PCMH-type domain-containing protein n=1 Tax=Pseudooceanicola lipolyticus TaxID=2029104 RepID=A0A2M8J5R4_9RHOB|nr:FAD binding domain-containing protein [Pseudooceanicola lipolyticus]PJE38117.1 hypothetical protein CVM52_02950 [Pseudooceanicola lipolyticus]